MKGFIFDFDGVILNTEKYHYLAWKRTFEKYNLCLDEEEYLPLKSTGRKNIISSIEKKFSITFAEQEKLEIAEQKGIYYKEYFNMLDEKDFILGAKDFLEFLYSKNYLLAVASSSVAAKELCVKFNIDKYFNEIIMLDKTMNAKPDPDIFLKALELLNVKNDEAVVFEDSIAGVIAAKNANISCVGIGSFLRSKVDKTIDNFLNFEEKLKEFI